MLRAPHLINWFCKSFSACIIRSNIGIVFTLLLTATLIRLCFLSFCLHSCLCLFFFFSGFALDFALCILLYLCFDEHIFRIQLNRDGWTIFFILNSFGLLHFSVQLHCDSIFVKLLSFAHFTVLLNLCTAQHSIAQHTSLHGWHRMLPDPQRNTYLYSFARVMFIFNDVTNSKVKRTMCDIEFIISPTP